MVKSEVPHHGGQTGLPAVVEEMLVAVVADGFTLYCCGPKTTPNALAASYEWNHYIDLLTIRDFDRSPLPERRHRLGIRRYGEARLAVV